MAEIVLANTTYTLQYKFTEFCELEEQVGISLMDYLKKFSKSSLGFRDLSILIYSGTWRTL